MRDSSLVVAVCCMYHLCKLYIVVGRSLTSSGLTRGFPRTYWYFTSSFVIPGISSRLRSCSTVTPASLACLLRSSVITSRSAVLTCVCTMSGGIDCTACSPSWGTVFPLFLPTAWLELELDSFCPAEYDFLIDRT